MSCFCIGSRKSIGNHFRYFQDRGWSFKHKLTLVLSTESINSETQPAEEVKLFPYQQRHLILYHTFQGIGMAIFVAITFSLLLTTLSSSSLPIAFAISALAVLVVNRIHIYLEKYTYPEDLFKLAPITLAVITLVGLLTPTIGETKSILFLICYKVLWFIDDVTIWGISEKLFSPINHKKLHNQHHTFRILGKIIGYTLAMILFLAFNIQTMLVVAIGCFIVSYLALYFLFKYPLVHKRLKEYHRDMVIPLKKIPIDTFLNMLLSNKYLVMIGLQICSISGMITLCVFQILWQFEYTELTFFDSFIAVSLFFIAGYGISLAIRLVFRNNISNSKVNIYGLLLITPLLLLLLITPFLFIHFLYPDFHGFSYLFSFVILVTLLFEVFAYRSITGILLHPVNELYRAVTYSRLQGIFASIGVGAASLLVLILKQNFLLTHFNTFIFIVFIFLVGWTISAWQTAKLYIKIIYNSIKLRNLQSYELAVQSKSTLELLHNKLSSPHSEEVIYAISVLSELKILSLEELFTKCVGNPSPEVRLYVLQIVRRQKEKAKLLGDKLYKVFQEENNTDVKQQALKTYFILADPDLARIQELLHTASTEDKRYLLNALSVLEQDEIRSLLIREVNIFFKSMDVEDRLFAIEIIKESKLTYFNNEIQELLKGNDVELTLQAISACQALKDPIFIPDLLYFLQAQEFVKEVKQTLVHYGEKALPLIEKALVFSKRGNLNYPVHLCEVIGKIGGEHALEILWKLVNYPSQEMRIKAYEALSKFKVDTQDTITLYRIHDHLERVFRHEAWLYQALRVVNKEKNYSLLAKALKAEIQTIDKQVDTLSNILLNGQGINIEEIIDRQTFRHDEHDEFDLDDNINTTEVRKHLRKLFPQEIADKLAITQGFYTDEEKAIKLAFYNNYQPLDDLTVISSILKRKSGRGSLFNRWTIAVAIYTVADIASPNMLQHFAYYLGCDDLFFIEPALARLQKYSLYRGFNIETLLDELVAPERKKLLMSILNNDTKPMMQIEKVIILKSVKLFSDISERVLSDIADVSHEEKHERGSVVFHRGTPAQSMYIIYEGEVQFFKDNQIVDTYINRDIFGELDILDSHPRQFSAKVSKETILLRLDKEDLYQLMESRTEIMQGIIQNLCNRARNNSISVRSKRKKVRKK